VRLREENGLVINPELATGDGALGFWKAAKKVWPTVRCWAGALDAQRARPRAQGPAHRLHSRYGPSDRSTAQGGLCHEASAQPVTRPSRSSATRPIDNSLGGSFLHWRTAPLGRTE
jgi:hypothetical protein